MANNLARKIGIWYHDREWVERLFNDIFAGFPADCISHCRMAGTEIFICLKDGTTIIAYKENTSSRGMALTDSYIQYGIGYDFYATRIRPRTLWGNAGCYMINNYEDFRKPVKADEYWRKHFEQRNRSKTAEPDNNEFGVTNH